jgi:hypothetical protein
MRHSFDRLEKDIAQELDIERADNEARKLFERYTPKEATFSDVYDQTGLDRDIKRVEDLERAFDSQNTAEELRMKRISNIFEASILKHGELGNWFGGEAITVKTSKYDDYVNGVDTVIEFPEGEGQERHHLGLAADISFSPDIQKKFERVIGRIQKGELVDLKYFDSKEAGIHGKLANLPEVIIGADSRTVLELADLSLENQNKALAEHRIQIMLLMQIKAQLEAFTTYARYIGQDRIAEVYESRLATVDKIFADKRELTEKVKFEIDSDSVHSSIMAYVKSWSKSLEEPRRAAA